MVRASALLLLCVFNVLGPISGSTDDDVRAEIRKLVATVAQIKEEQSRFSREIADVVNKLEATVQQNQAVISETQCPQKDLNLTTLANGKAYFFSSEKKVKWYEAKEFCEKHKMHLASPKTQEELDYLHEKAKQLPQPQPGYPAWWLSASDVGREEGDFQWHDGTPLSRNSTLWFKDGETDQPDEFGRGEQTCVHILAGDGRFIHFPAKLADYYCTELCSYICEVPYWCL